MLHHNPGLYYYRSMYTTLVQLTLISQLLVILNIIGAPVDVCWCCAAISHITYCSNGTTIGQFCGSESVDLCVA